MKKIYKKPVVEIEVYELSASIAANCGTVISLGPEGGPDGVVCKEFGGGFDPYMYNPRPEINFRVSGGTPFYEDANSKCTCYYSSGGSGYFTS